MSKFDELLRAAPRQRPGRTEASPDPTPAPEIRPAAETRRDDEPRTPRADPPSPAPVEPPPRRGPGRPRGKRSDPGFVQATAYIPDEIHHKVKLALLQERKGREFSELVGELLADWLAKRDSS